MKMGRKKRSAFFDKVKLVGLKLKSEFLVGDTTKMLPVDERTFSRAKQIYI